jgi:hypothetical protein
MGILVALLRRWPILFVDGLAARKHIPKSPNYLRTVILPHLLCCALFFKGLIPKFKTWSVLRDQFFFWTLRT